MLTLLDNMAAARDLAQLEQQGKLAHLFNVWLEHETGTAPAAAGRNQRPAMEVGCTAALLLQAVSVKGTTLAQCSDLLSLLPLLLPKNIIVTFRICFQDLVYNHKVMKRLSSALSRAVQLLLTRPKQKQKQRKPGQLQMPDVATEVAIVLMASLSSFLKAWNASLLPARRDADLLQIAVQVAESGAQDCCACPPKQALAAAGAVV
jgi:hypothetical protein